MKLSIFTWLCFLEGACFPFSLAGPGVAGYLTTGTSSSVMSNLPPPVDHEAGDVGYPTWNICERQEMLKGQSVPSPHSSSRNKLLLPFSWFHDSVIPFSINIFLFRKKVSDSNYITLQESTLWINLSGYARIFFLDVCKHILFLYICLQDCESKRENFLPSFYNVFSN